MRWRTQSEVVNGKGRTICGSISCSGAEQLGGYEVPFMYADNEVVKHELVKVQLCPKCSKYLLLAKQPEAKSNSSNPDSGQTNQRRKRESSLITSANPEKPADTTGEVEIMPPPPPKKAIIDLS